LNWHFIKFTNTRSEETKSREVQGRSKGAKKFKGAQIHSLNRNLSSSKTNKRSSLLSPLSSYSSNSPSPSCSSTLENSLADAALLAAFSSSDLALLLSSRTRARKKQSPEKCKG